VRDRRCAALGRKTSMKKCSWCGKEYSDDASICAIDQSPLMSDSPTASVPETGSVPSAEPALRVQLEERVLSDDESNGEHGFLSLGQFDAFEAARLLRRFETEGIQFRIDQVERSAITARGVRRTDAIEIYVHQDDQGKANSILTEDWKV
jgi:hypothetical protein